MKKIKTWSWVMLVLLMLGGNVFSNDVGHLKMFLGMRELPGSFWGATKDQTVIGFNADWSLNESENYFSVSFLQGRGTGKDSFFPSIEYFSKTNEIRAGYRRYVALSDSVLLFFGGGGIYSSTTISINEHDIEFWSDQDSSFGPYLEVASIFNLKNNWQLGINMDYSNASHTLSKTKVDTGGLLFALNLGYKY